MAIDAQDKEFLDTADEALSEAWDRYHAAPDSEKLLLYPQVDLAYRKLLEARMKLLEPVTITTASDLAEIRKLRDAINNAADNQAVLMALVRIIAIVAKL